ncbi:MAG: RNA polymerase sigma factor [Candidatus Dojkabacteria bacterium]
MDKGILLKAKQGDKACLAQIFDNYLDRVYRYIYIRIHNKETAEDLASTVFIKVIEHIHKLDVDKNFEAWLFTITRNTLIDMLRKNRFVSSNEMIEIAEDSTDHEDRSDNQMVIERIKEKFDNLKELEREIVELTYFAQLNDKEISLVVGKPPGNIRVVRFRAIKKLRKSLE